jgi:hypothetical protein
MRFPQECDLVRRRFAAENDVTVRKPPEALNDLLVAQHVFHLLEGALAGAAAMLLGPAPEQGDGAGLVLGILGMFERQVEEEAAVERGASIEAALDRGVGGGARPGVAGKGAQRAAMDVARELVEQQHERQRTVDGAHPIVEIADAGRRHVGAEAVADLLVEARVLFEP